MPPRYAYWTILIDNKPTAFRSRDEEELLPTLNQLRRKNSDVVMKWFARGRLWDTPAQAQWARENLEGSAERRARDWRPGGEHKDPRARFKKRKKERPAGGAQGQRPWQQPGPRSARPGRDSLTPGAGKNGPPWSRRPPSGASESGRSERDRPGPGPVKNLPPWRRKPPSGAAKGGSAWQHKPPTGAAKGGPPWRRKPPSTSGAGKSGPPWGGRPSSGGGEGGRSSRDSAGKGAPEGGRPGRGARSSGANEDQRPARANPPPPHGLPPGAGDKRPGADIAHRPDAQESPTPQRGEKSSIDPER